MSVSPSGVPSATSRGIDIALGGRTIAAGLSFDVPERETLCVLGRSGVGKSSLLRWLAGLLPGSPARTDVAWMAQQDLLLPWASVLENVVVGYRLRGAPAPLDRARALLADVGLADRVDDLPAALSGGMRQRAALARTICEDRPVVLMDEPFAQLDAITRLDLQDLAARLLVGRTVVLVTHDPMEALRLGHEVRVVAGPPLSIAHRTRPAGCPPRNPGAPALLTEQGALLATLRGAP
ncbi:MAG: ABC transporter ATP-binding protein [Alphaproteobacteria bacterium]|nr:ABC transporter ATP-binding protein [Alphaproteobacteria bacterium]MBM3643941.1 ABC transporter ATP-binding protein [Alphaproteobacteria bacterium]